MPIDRAVPAMMRIAISVSWAFRSCFFCSAISARRDRSASDRRTVAVTITPEGGRVLRDAPSLLQDRFNSELERLEQFEQTQILATLQRIAWMMDAEDIDAAPLLETGALTAPAVPAPKSAAAQIEETDVNGSREDRADAAHVRSGRVPRA